MRYVLIVPVLGLLVLFLSYASSGRRPKAPQSLIEIELKDIGVDPASRSPVLIITDREKGRVLPIFIGINEASAISRGLSGEETRRPLTHDLIVNMIEKLGADLTRVVIRDLKDNIFLADLVLSFKNKEVTVDCRPSDAIAVAVRLGTPLFITRDVLESSLNEELTEWWHREGTTSRLGLNLQDLTEELARAMGVGEQEGVIVSSVQEEGVADEAGIRRGDIIVSIDGEAVKEPVEVGIMLSERSGEEVDLFILRAGEELHISIPVPAAGGGGRR